jgi:uncharacterized protein (DUF488 family)
MAGRPIVFTVGHSNGDLDAWVRLVSESGIEEIVDVRTAPFSRFAPQFNAPVLTAALPKVGITYSTEGEALGGRPSDPAAYDDEGHVLYGRVAASAAFIEGIQRVESRAMARRIALLCSEEDPAGCHRHLLIGRVLNTRGVQVLHLRRTGEVELYEAIAGHQAASQETLFGPTDEDEDVTWRSIRSVSPSGARKSSSER